MRGPGLIGVCVSVSVSVAQGCGKGARVCVSVARGCGKGARVCVSLAPGCGEGARADWCVCICVCVYVCVSGLTGVWGVRVYMCCECGFQSENLTGLMGGGVCIGGCVVCVVCV